MKEWKFLNKREKQEILFHFLWIVIPYVVCIFLVIIILLMEHRIMAITPAFDSGDVGSIPSAPATFNNGDYNE